MSASKSFLLWRAWKPLYSFPAVFSALACHPIGGTCSQLLWHAKALTAAGHRVQVLGVSPTDIVEEGVEFLGSHDRASQEELMQSRRVREPFAVLLEGGYAAAPLIRSRYPRAAIVQVCQNMDRWGRRRILQMDRFVDLYAMVSPGQLALYAVKMPKLRSKMTLVRNAIPWTEVHSRIVPLTETDTVAWVGGWTKKGLRDWGCAMEKILAEYPTWQWELFGQSYGRDSVGIAPDVFHGLRLPADRVQVRSLAMAEMLTRLTAARIVGVSLGNECGPSSALDGHAMGKPVVSGNDVVYSFVNPCQTGLRANNSQEIYAAVRSLIQSEELRRHLGAAGTQFVMRDFTEASQERDLHQLVQQIEAFTLAGTSATLCGTSLWREVLDDVSAMLQRKIRSRRARAEDRAGVTVGC